MSEVLIAERFMNATLGVPELLTALPARPATMGNGLYNTHSGRNDVYPYVVFSFYSGSDTINIGAERIFTRLQFLVKVVDKGLRPAVIAPIVEIVDRLLQNANGIVGANVGIVYTFYRDRPISYVEEDSGVLYRHEGGIYDGIVQAI